jgi:hypothetical protein
MKKGVEWFMYICQGWIKIKRQMHYLSGIGQEKTFELMAIKLLNTKMVIIYQRLEEPVIKVIHKINGTSPKKTRKYSG